ncbi:unnamed protein product [Callosobruchus maculatus]|uniref:Uncharacterized protein n=1 Tax=Callosobruchus maculatus TaxID=64391 RepID=A0A653CBD2_CALMS|nr:unnamed protein product [Callosobruchus maculatus]
MRQILFSQPPELSIKERRYTKLGNGLLTLFGDDYRALYLRS